MKTGKKVLFGFVLFLLSAAAVSGQSAYNSLFALRVTPGIGVPIAGDTVFYDLGGAANISGEITMPFFPLLFASVDVGYNYIPTGAPTSLSVMAFGIGAGLDFPILPVLSTRIFGKGGYYYGILHNGAGNAGNPYVFGGAGLWLKPFSRIGFGVDVAYRNFLGTYSDLSVTAGVVVNVVPAKRAAGGGIIEHKPGEGLDLLDLNLQPVFPVFYKYYDENPIGSARIKNMEKKPIEDIEITFYVKQYMDNPKTCKAPKTLEPGDEADIDLFGLFTNNLLSISEGTKVSAQIETTYTVPAGECRKETITTLTIHNRNAMSWDDDRKAAAFVTAKDSSILKFAKNTAGIVTANSSPAVNRNLLLAMGIFTAFKQQGMSYVIDPSTPYTELSENADAVDFIQFPVQSLEYKAGDCDDLSILYAALLEAVGIKTAFITIPGHIYMAFSADIGADQIETTFSRPEDCIAMDDTAWIPVEVTAIENGFLHAWQLGAKEWREHAAKMQVGFFPVHEAWQEYQPVGFDIIQTSLELPETNKLRTAFVNEYTTFVEREIYPRLEKLTEKIRQGQNYRARNRLGALYARYGLYEKAAAEFEKVVEQQEFFPALVNLGNIYYLDGELEGALKMYRRAAAIRPNNANLQLGIARANHALEQYEKTAAAFSMVKQLDPDLAERFSYLDLQGEASSRAADITQLKGVMVWEEELPEEE